MRSRIGLSVTLLAAVVSFQSANSASLTITSSIVVDSANSLDGSLYVFDGTDQQTVVRVVDGGRVSGEVIEAYDTSVIQIDGGDVGDINGFDQSSVEISGGDLGSVSAFDSAYVRLSGGTVDENSDAGYVKYAPDKQFDHSVSAYHNGIIDIYGGSIESGLVANRGGNISLFGGTFKNGFVVSPGSIVNVFGRDLLLTEIEATETYRENLLTGFLRDGSPLDVLAVSRISDGVAGEIRLFSIPEPSTIALSLLAVSPSAQMQPSRGA